MPKRVENRDKVVRFPKVTLALLVRVIVPFRVVYL